MIFEVEDKYDELPSYLKFFQKYKTMIYINNELVQNDEENVERLFHHGVDGKVLTLRFPFHTKEQMNDTFVFEFGEYIHCGACSAILFVYVEEEIWEDNEEAIPISFQQTLSIADRGVYVFWEELQKIKERILITEELKSELQAAEMIKKELDAADAGAEKEAVDKKREIKDDDVDDDACADAKKARVF